MERIALLPLGDIDANLLEKMAQFIARVFLAEIVMEDSLPNPERAFDANRNQYNSSTIIQMFREKGSKYDRALLITTADLFTERSSFIFGEAHTASGVAIVSFARLRQSFYGLPEDGKLFFERCLKEAFHALGRLYGITPCSNPGCVMHPSDTLPDIDLKSVSFCKRCKEWIHQAAG
jgi:archaemetzincin